MQNVANFLDHTLYALVALTVALIVYKILNLYTPSHVGTRAVLPTAAGHVDEYVEELEKGMALLAVIASAAPFIGLGGTVIHIMEALTKMASAAVDISLISGPISTALRSTLVGLASAVPAMVAYNLLQRRIQVLHNRVERKFKGN